MSKTRAYVMGLSMTLCTMGLAVSGCAERPGVKKEDKDKKKDADKKGDKKGDKKDDNKDDKKKE